MAARLRLPRSLWDHQRDAVRTIESYLSASDAKRAGRSALITMPTGTGKTGVIASAVALLPVDGHRLVLTPWDALVRQMIADIRSGFWARLPQAERPPEPVVRRLPPSSQLDKIAAAAAPTVFVATIAAILEIVDRCDEEGVAVSDLFSDFGVVIVDEGHYEPAFKWSVAIRSLSRPTVLLTATPYRNDRKFFRVDDTWRYRYPHYQAEADRFLRTPAFEVTHEADPSTFAADVIARIDARFPAENARVIVRCKTADGIRKVVDGFARLGQEVLGVHHTFPPHAGPLHRDVPDARNSDARVWVHQNKLIEGIDDPRFKVVAFYDPLANDRAVIQQIGRALRNPSRAETDAAALVIGRSRDLARTWRAYQRFDREDEAQAVATAPDLIQRLLAAQPDSYYFDGGYRATIDPDDPEAWREFAFPLRTRIYRRRSDTAPDLAEVAVEAAAEWEDIDRTVYRTQVPDEATVILPFATVENSPLLISGGFFEPEFGYTVIRASEDLLFVWDSRGRTPQVVLDHYRPLAPAELTPLFPDGASALTSVSLLNTDIGRQAIRAQQIRAAAIEELAPGLSDYSYVCSVAEGYTEVADGGVRRYLGLSKSRLSDYRYTDREFDTYVRWLEDIAGDLRHGGPGSRTFARYAKYVPTPAQPEPIHVLLDVQAEFAEAKVAP